MNVAETVRRVILENPNMKNDEIAIKVRELCPGSSPSSASVASIKSRLKKDAAMGSTAQLPLTLIDGAPASVIPEPELPQETDEERSKRIRSRYHTLQRMAERVAAGRLPALIVSGPPGLGKSFTIEQVLVQNDIEHDILCGTISAVGLYIALWEQRDGGVVVLDDCDDALRDETCLNLLKAVLDSSDKRIVSYRKRAHWMDEMDIPNTFEFKGAVVFCTNIDFESTIRRGTGMAPHFEALIDRSLYLSLTMRTQEDFLTRLQHVGVEDKLLVKKGLTEEQALEVMAFIRKNADRFYGLSIRLLLQIAACYKEEPDFWELDVEATKMRVL